jgi:hypothetical protein
VRQIVQLAGVGEPAAKKALTALKVAKRIKAKKAGNARPKPKKALVPVSLPKKARAIRLAQPSQPPATVPATVTSTTSTLRRWLDVFAPWRRGVG